MEALCLAFLFLVWTVGCFMAGAAYGWWRSGEWWEREIMKSVRRKR